LDSLTKEDLDTRGAAARRRYLSTYSPAVNTPLLLDTYAQLVDDGS
jgi:hypothetical protein